MMNEYEYVQQLFRRVKDETEKKILTRSTRIIIIICKRGQVNENIYIS